MVPRPGRHSVVLRVSALLCAVLSQALTPRGWEAPSSALETSPRPPQNRVSSASSPARLPPGSGPSRRTVYPRWIKYTDKVTNECLLRRRLTLISFLAALQTCERKHQQLLGCGTEIHNILELKLPCGHISMQTVSTSVIFWSISVFEGFHLQLAFRQFTLPMPSRRCFRTEAMEFVIVATFRFRDPKEHYFCGKIFPFALVFDVSRATVWYACKKLNMCTGSFHIQYQVIEKGWVHLSHAMQLVTVMKGKPVGVAQFLTLPEKPFTFHIPISIRTTGSKLLGQFSFHLVGDKLTQVQLRANFVMNVDLHSWKITAFDGPGSSNKHVHSGSNLLLTGRAIRSVTFQAFVQIQCPYGARSALRLLYSWHWSLEGNVKVIYLFIRLRHIWQVCQNR